MSDAVEMEEVLRRTREVEAELEASQRRIDALMGLDEGSPRLRRWRDRFKLEARRELPPIDGPTAHEALAEALHRETGLVGAVRTQGVEMTWKPLAAVQTNQAGATLEVSLVGGEEAPALEVTSRSRGQRSQLVTVGAMVVTMVAVAMAMIVLELKGIALLVAAPLLVLASLFVTMRLTRRIAQREHSELVGRLADAVSEQSLKVRVADAEHEEADELEEVEEARASRKERSRGVS